MRAALVALALAVLPAQAAPGVIAYTRGTTVYVARPDGTGERAYATGFAPALAPGGPEIAYSVRSGGAAQLVVARLDQPGSARQLTSLPNEEPAYGEGRYGVYGAVWSPSRTRLALRLMEGSTTTLATIDADGSDYRRYEFGHLFGSRIVWRDDDSLVVGTDQGLRLVTVGGEPQPVRGAESGDTPVYFESADILWVNGADGAMHAVFVGGNDRAGGPGGTGWGVVPGLGLVFTTGAELRLRTGGEAERYAGLPVHSAEVINVVTDRVPVLAETADGIYAIPRNGTATRVATGSGVTVSNAVAYDAVAFGAVSGAAGTTAGPPPGRSALTHAVPDAGEVSTDAGRLATNALLAFLLMLLLTFPAELFNSTLEEHYAEVRGWFGLRAEPKPPAERSRARRMAMFAAYAAVAALLYGLLDPGFGLDGASARLYAGLVVGLVVVTLAFGAVPLAYVRRRYGERGALRVLPGTLLVGAFCVLVSRLAGFEPGYVYGIVGGFAFSRAFSRDEEGRNALVTALGVLTVSVAAWLLWQPVDDAAAAGDPGLLLGIADSTLATVALGGLEGLVIGLLPLRSLQGYALSRWSRPVWAAVFFGVLLLFVHLLVRPENAESTVPFGTWLALFLGFGAVSVAFWGWFRIRPSSG